MNGLVSVVIPTFNREKTIVRAVDSVLSQTYKNIEIIVVDDCSTDHTLDILKGRYGEIANVTVFQLKKNSGACAARNKGIELSKGEYIAFLDSDDAFFEDKVEKQVKALVSSGKQLCATSYLRIDQTGKKSTVHVHENQDISLYEELLYCNFITTGVILGEARCLQETKFDERLPRYQDWDLVLRLAQKYEFCLIDEEMMLQEHQAISITSSTSHQKTYAAMRIIYEKHENAFEQNKRARAQYFWLMGVHSMYTERRRFDYLWYGVVGDGLKPRRLLIWMYYKLRLYRWIDLPV